MMPGGKQKTTRRQEQTSTASSQDGEFRHYFRLPSVFWMALITLSIALLFASTFAPDSIPDIFGPFAMFGKYMGHNHHNVCIGLSFFTVIAHTLEAAYAGKISHDIGMTAGVIVLWALSTFLFGFSSLILLRKHCHMMSKRA